ncbi:MAG: inositol-3-phosphate synthase [Candidatus Heimdallarchaeota archaeon]|nr:inositol-3-phosphate synthase [Candidatus Heimdallarchaeota archaeon]MBY8993694.1 inositol-3-phosphate synthase [Candidatus Heimdallarchaeota archaeon]
MAGIWLIGAYGAVSTTTMTGIAAIKTGAAPRVQVGMVTEAPECDPIRSKFPLEEIAVGGHEVRFLDRNAYQASEKIWEENVHFQRSYLDKGKNELSKIKAKKGTAINCGPGVDALGELDTLEGEGLTLSEIISRIMKDYESFKNKNGEVCVINAASTEPHIPLTEAHQSLDTFEGLIDENQTEMVTASMLYAYAAFKQKIPYGNFTPSHGATVPAIRELAVKQKMPYMGDDGKTGETLMKTTLAPMFKMRNLKILGWAGFNILGDDDGVTLSKDANKASKIESKDKAISSSIGYSPFSITEIKYFPPLVDHKVAWDYISYRGFLGTKMALQFTWHGIDSILAAPIAIDIARSLMFAKSRGEFGAIHELAFFFKHPIDDIIGNTFIQYELYNNWINEGRTVELKKMQAKIVK